MMHILTTHSPSHPLLQALIKEGVKITHLKKIEEFSTIPLETMDLWFGNLFTELKHPIALYNLVSKLRKHSIPYVFWNRDAPWNCGMKTWHRWVLYAIKPLDIYFTHSGQEHFPCEQFCYLPNAARPEYKFTGNLEELRDEQHYLYDICFMGALGNTKRAGCLQRRLFVKELQHLLKQQNPSIRIKIIDTSIEKPSLREQLQLIQRSKINLNYGANCDLPEQLSWGLPERVFGIPAAGGFLLTEYRDCLKDTFIATTYDDFHDTKECVEKVIFYLKNLNTLRDRAEALHYQILENHMYSHRAATFISHLPNQKI